MPVEHTERKRNMTFYNGACQNCLDPCKRQLCTDPVTTSPPPSLSPEPLALGKGRDSPPSPRVSLGLPKWSVMAEALVGQMLTSGKALSICQGRKGGLSPDVQIKLHRFVLIVSSPGKRKHWEFVGAFGSIWLVWQANESGSLARVLGETDRCHIKALLLPFLQVPLSLALSSQRGNLPTCSQVHRQALSTMTVRASGLCIGSNSVLKQDT